MVDIEGGSAGTWFSGSSSSPNQLFPYGCKQDPRTYPICLNIMHSATEILGGGLWILGALLFLTALLYNIMFFCKYDSIDLIIKP